MISLCRLLFLLWHMCLIFSPSADAELYRPFYRRHYYKQTTAKSQNFEISAQADTRTYRQLPLSTFQKRYPSWYRITQSLRSLFSFSRIHEEKKVNHAINQTYGEVSKNVIHQKRSSPTGISAQRFQSPSTSVEFKKHLKHQMWRKKWPNDNIVEMGENKNGKVPEFLDSALKKMLERKRRIL